MTHYSLGFAIVRRLTGHVRADERAALDRLADGAGSADDLRVAVALARRVDKTLAEAIIDAPGRRAVAVDV